MINIVYTNCFLYFFIFLFYLLLCTSAPHRGCTAWRYPVGAVTILPCMLVLGCHRAMGTSAWPPLSS